MIATARPRVFFFASAIFTFSASLMMLLGCDSSKPDSKVIVPVKGRVLLDGEPLAGARVTFIPISPIDSAQGDPQPMSYGITDAEGSYSLQQADGTEGAVKGQHTVMISKPIDRSSAPASVDSRPNAVPDFYRQHGYLKRHVMPLAGSQQMDFKLSSVDPLLKGLK